MQLALLCSDSWNHNYTINRKEAKESLGLKIDKPDDELYAIIKSIYDDLSDEMELRKHFNPAEILGTKEETFYEAKRAILESLSFGQYAFVTKGRIKKVVMDDGKMVQIQENRFFENWVRS